MLNLASPVPSDAVRRRLSEVVPESDRLALEFAFTMRRAVQKIDAALGRFLSDDSLTPGRWHVLVILWSCDAPITQSEIVETLDVSRPTVSGLIDTLRAEGHVTTAIDHTDRRQVRVALTPTARAMTQRLVKRNADRLRQELVSLTDAELTRMSRLLQKAAL